MSLKHRIISLIICITIIAGLFSMSGCESGKLPTDLSDVAIEGTSGGLTGKPWETDVSASFAQKKDEAPELSAFVQPEEGTLLKYMGFDDLDEKTRKSSALALGRLGIYTDSITDGAHDAMKTHLDFGLDAGGENVVMKITGYSQNADELYGNGYTFLVPSNEIGAYTNGTFTYQYDLQYGESGNAAAYVGIATGYNSENYNIFAVKNTGVGINQLRVDRDYYNYDEKGDYYAADTGSGSIIKEILGKNYDKSAWALTGIPISVRGVIRPNGENSFYVRVNDEGYPGSGKWTLVSKSADGSAGAKQAENTELGYNVVLVTMSSPNATFDNFMIWTGDGDEPADKSRPLLSGTTDKCTAHLFTGDGTSCLTAPTCVYCGYKKSAPEHRFTEIPGGGDAICEDCHCYYRSLIDWNWPMTDVPLFNEGGSIAVNTYNMGQVPTDTEYSIENESLVQLIESATPDMLKRYCKRLEGYGFARVFENSIGENLYYQYVRGDKSIYAYYSKGQGGEIRLIVDKKDVVTPDDISFDAEKGKPKDTEFYQFGMDENVRTEGMCYVIKLCDDSLVIIDGYHRTQLADERIDDFMEFLREITGKKEGETMRIAAWISTHAHTDHFEGLSNVISKYPESFTIDSVISNYPSTHCNTSIFVSAAGSMNKISTFLAKIADENTKFIKAHSGQRFSLAGVVVTIMFAPDDLVDTTSPVVDVSDFNSSSLVFKIEINGTRIMMLGDTTSFVSGIIAGNFDDEELKSDVVQTAHHLYNIMDGLYSRIHAEYVLVTTAESFVNEYGRHVLGNLNAAKKFTTDDKVFFEATATYGFSFKTKGKFKHFYTRPLLRANG